MVYFFVCLFNYAGKRLLHLGKSYSIGIVLVPGKVLVES